MAATPLQKARTVLTDHVGAPIPGHEWSTLLKLVTPAFTFTIEERDDLAKAFSCWKYIAQTRSFKGWEEQQAGLETAMASVLGFDFGEVNVATPANSAPVATATTEHGDGTARVKRLPHTDPTRIPALPAGRATEVLNALFKPVMDKVDDFSLKPVLQELATDNREKTMATLIRLVIGCRVCSKKATGMLKEEKGWYALQSPRLSRKNSDKRIKEYQQTIEEIEQVRKLLADAARDLGADEKDLHEVVEVEDEDDY